MVLAELGGAIKGALSKLNNATVIDEEGPSLSLRAPLLAPPAETELCAAPDVPLSQRWTRC